MNTYYCRNMTNWATASSCLLVLFMDTQVSTLRLLLWHCLANNKTGTNNWHLLTKRKKKENVPFSQYSVAGSQHSPCHHSESKTEVVLLILSIVLKELWITHVLKLNNPVHQMACYCIYITTFSARSISLNPFVCSCDWSLSFFCISLWLHYCRGVLIAADSSLLCFHTIRWVSNRHKYCCK